MEALEAWIGRTETRQDVATPVPYAALAATLGYPSALPAPGTPLPPLWHWLYFLPLHRLDDTAVDGHATRGGFLPPVDLPRRMWAGGALRFHSPMRIGDALTRVSTIEDVTQKQGRTGPLVFVRVRHEIRTGASPDAALTEHHDIVYRGVSDVAAARAAQAAQPVDRGPWRRSWMPDEVLLFRYSALTFNAHRIHYDRRYVTEVEGYPGLVVHGPLIATLLLDLVRREASQAPVRAFRFRAVRPMFDGRPFEVCGEPGRAGEPARLWARDPDGFAAMEAEAELGPS